MKKEVPKRRDLRKRIKALEAEIKMLRNPPKCAVSERPVRTLYCKQKLNRFILEDNPEMAYRFAVAGIAQGIGKQLIANGQVYIYEAGMDDGRGLIAQILTVEPPFAGVENEYIKAISEYWRNEAK